MRGQSQVIKMGGNMRVIQLKDWTFDLSGSLHTRTAVDCASIIAQMIDAFGLEYNSEHGDLRYRLFHEHDSRTQVLEGRCATCGVQARVRLSSYRIPDHNIPDAITVRRDLRLLLESYPCLVPRRQRTFDWDRLKEVEDEGLDLKQLLDLAQLHGEEGERMTNERQFNVRIDEAIVEALRRSAEDNRRSMTGELEILLRDALKNYMKGEDNGQ